MKTPAIFLDRDGILIDVVFQAGVLAVPYNLDQVLLRPGVSEALVALKAAGFQLIVVTNQPNIASGEVSKESIEEIHAFLRKQFPQLDAIYYCPHQRSDGCGCKKPMPGMVEQAAKDRGVDVSKSFIIGDRKGDIDMGLSTGMRGTILIPSEATFWRTDEKPEPHFQAENIEKAVEYILSHP